jgi:hypothetical protein
VRLTLAISILLFTRATWAHQPEDGQVYGSLGAFTYMTPPLNHQFESPVFFGPGILGEADINKNGGLEIGFFYLRNPFSVRFDNKTIVEGLKRIYITTGWRQWFTPKFSAALAFSSSYAFGDLHIMRDDFNGIDRPRTSASDITEYGIDGSIQYEPYSEGRFSIVIDGRYNRSITPKRNEDSDHMGVFISMKYFIQSREKIPDDEEE